MFKLGQFALGGMHGGIPITTVLTFFNAPFFEIDQLLGVAEDIGRRLIDGHGDGITQTLLAFAPMHGTTTDALWQLLMRHD